jgi:hypothetical protein
MPIHPLLARQAFQPETVAEMAEAVERTRDALGLQNISDMATNLVAQKIIELAQRGVMGADALSSRAVRELTDQ